MGRCPPSERDVSPSPLRLEPRQYSESGPRDPWGAARAPYGDMVERACTPASAGLRFTPGVQFAPSIQV